MGEKDFIKLLGALLNSYNDENISYDKWYTFSISFKKDGEDKVNLGSPCLVAGDLIIKQ